MALSDLDKRVAQIARIAAEGLLDFAFQIEQGGPLSEQHDTFFRWMEGTSDLFRCHVRGALLEQRVLVRRTDLDNTEDTQ
jgi:hypothetical protein